MNDADDKSDKDCSIVENQEAQSKRRKVDGFNDVFSSANNNVTNKNMTKCDDKDSRKNLILGMFNKNSLEKNTSQNTLSKTESSDNNLLKSCNDRTQNHEDRQLSKKSLVLGILKKQNVQEKITQNISNSKLQKVEIEIKSNANATQQREAVSKNEEVHFQRSTRDEQNLSENSRKQLLNNLLKQQSIASVELKNNIVKNNASGSKLPRIQHNKKMTLVRRFPGPAGLLPDNIDANVPPALYINSLEENEQTKEPSDTDLPEYCSQNTRSLFTEGAWQLMLNNLPDGFLKGYEIATIKQIANARKCYSTKVNFLAGIVEQIDHSHENPLIVLKDFTDSIHGIIHRDIPHKYPGLLESNAVVLLHDVGLLKTSASFTSGRYRILISPSNLLAIYSNDGQVEHTEYMKSVLESVSNGEVEEKEGEMDRILTKPLEKQSFANLKHKVEDANNIKEKTNRLKHITDSDKTSSSLNTNWNKAFDDMSELVDFDFTDDCSFSVFSDIIINSQNNKNVNNSMSTSPKYIENQSKQQTSNKLSEKNKEVVQDDKQRSENVPEYLRRFSPNTDRKKKLSHHSKGLQKNVEHPASPAPPNTYLGEVTANTVNKASARELDPETCNINMSHESDQFNNHKEKSKVSIRSKLIEFKNTDVLTPPQNPEPKELLDQEKADRMFQNEKLFETQKSSFAMNCDAENDSADEMLSQLDMDTIFSNYNENS